MNYERRYEPLGGLDAEIAAAEADLPAGDEVEAIWAAAKAGNPGELLCRYRVLVYQEAKRLAVYHVSRGRYVWPDELYGPLYQGLAACARCLAKNDTTAKGLLQYLKNELRKRACSYLRETIPGLIPPSSTKSSQRKRGKPIAEAQFFSTYEHESASEPPPFSIFEQIEAEDDEDEPMTHDEQSFQALRDHLARSPLEHSILDCIEAGLSFRLTAKECKITKHHVETTVARMRQRALEI